MTDWRAQYPWATDAGREPPAYFPESPRATWGPGPWEREPDYIYWTSQVGYPAAIRRSPVSGSLNGYVAVPEGHPYHGLDWQTLELGVEPHGGLTYAGHMTLVELGWWLGFDSAHAYDHMPAIEALCHSLRGPQHWARYAVQGQPVPEPFQGLGGTYRPLAYMMAETESLARELHAAAAGAAMMHAAIAAEPVPERD